MEPQRTSIDDVPVLWLDAPPPFAMHLIFRVGRMDEPLGLHGITHLIEHLTMHGVPDPPPRANASVEMTTTRFFAEGTSEAVARFITDVCHSLTALPTQRQDTERRILELEGGGMGTPQMLLHLRWGARGPGTAAWRDRAADVAEAHTVQRWSDDHFTADNAVVWMTGPPPRNLSLPLRRGKARRPQLPPTIERALPAYTDLPQVPPYHVAVGFVQPRSRTLEAMSSLLELRTYRKIRRDLGISYDTASGYEPLDATRAHVFALADHAPEDAQAAARALTALVLDAAEVTEQELDHVRADLAFPVTNPSAYGTILDEAALSVLFDDTMPDARTSSLDDVTAESLTGLLRQAAAEAMFILPPDVEVDPRLHHAPMNGFGTPGRGDGRYFKPSYRMPRMRVTRSGVVLGDQTVSARLPSGWHCASLKDVAALMIWRDGWRNLVFNDGGELSIHPGMLAAGEEFVRLLEARVPPDRTWHVRADSVAADDR